MKNFRVILFASGCRAFAFDRHRWWNHRDGANGNEAEPLTEKMEFLYAAFAFSTGDL
jgi:hypothetical protein